MHQHQHHTQERAASGPRGDTGFDAGTESLSRALGLCFTVLKVVMILLLAAYLFSGIYTVQPHETALRLHFGEVVAELEDGLHIAWPFPIDEIVKIDSNKVRDIEIGTFWYSTATGRGEKAMREEREELRNTPKGERVAGKGGYIMTGDVNILHYYLTVRYRISDALLYYRNVTGEDVTDRTRADQLVRVAVENGVVRTVNSQEVYDALQNDVQTITRRVSREAQSILDSELETESGGTGIEIVQVVASMPPIPPRQAAAAFAGVFQAREDRRRQIETAEGYVNNLMGQTLGSLGRPVYDAYAAYDMAEDALDRIANIQARMEEIDEEIKEAEAALKEAEAGLQAKLEQELNELKAEKKGLPQELEGVRAGSARLARHVKERVPGRYLEHPAALQDYASLTEHLPKVIDRMYAEAEGQVSATLNEARTYKGNVKQVLRAEAERIDELKANGIDLETYLAQMRLQAIQDVITGADDVYILNPSRSDGRKEVRIKISAPPELLKQKRAVQETR